LAKYFETNAILFKFIDYAYFNSNKLSLRSVYRLLLLNRLTYFIRFLLWTLAILFPYACMPMIVFCLWHVLPLPIFNF